MKRSKFGAISAMIGILLGLILILGGIGIIAIGYTDAWGLWSKYIDSTSEPAVDAGEVELSVIVTSVGDIVNTTNDIKDNKYVIAVADGTVGIWNKIPNNYKPGVLGGIVMILGLVFLICGMVCFRRKSKKTTCVCAAIDALVFLCLAVVTVLLGIGGCELIILLPTIGGVVLFGILFPLFKVCGCASYAKRESEYKNQKTITFVINTPKDGASHKSKDRKKQSKKQKRLSRHTKKHKKDNKVLSQPTTITRVNHNQTGINMQGFYANDEQTSKPEKKGKK